MAGLAASVAEEVDLDSIGKGGPDLDPVLFLDVFVNGQPRNQIAEFRIGADGAIAARPDELREIGLDPPADSSGSDWLDLSSLPSGKFTYDPLQQRIFIETATEGLSVTSYSAQAGPARDMSAPAATGFYLNYDIGAYANSNAANEVSLDGISSRLEAWSFSPLGNLHNSALLSFDGGTGAFSARRLDSYYTISNRERQTNLRIGDLITGGMPWTRPIRLAGIQYRRSFETRPDLITTPLPSFSGSANVPSTVDVFLGSVKLSSTDIDPGRFDLHDIPAPASQGNLRVVVQGEDGAYQEFDLPFFADDSLLKQGLLDFSLEAGVPRTGYGTAEDRYGSDPVVTASARYGLTDAFTLEAHTELSANLANGGLGAVAALGPLGRVHGSITASQFDDRFGAKVTAEYDLSLGALHLGLATTRLFGDYADLARTTAVASDLVTQGNDRAISFDRASLTFAPANANWATTIGVSHLENANGERSHFGTFSFNTKLAEHAHFYAYGQTDLDDFGKFGIYAGVTFQLGGGRSMSAGTHVEEDTIAASASYSRSIRDGSNHRQYAVAMNAVADRVELSGNANWSGSHTQSRARFNVGSDRSYFSGGIKGALLVQEGHVAPSRYIDDAYVIALTGVPDIPVMLENRLAGYTDKGGRLVLTGLRAYEAYKVSIDPNALPLHYPITNVARVVTAPQRSGVVLDFKSTATANRQALVELVDATGKHLPAGASIRLAGSQEQHVVGYDGEAYLPVETGENSFTVDTPATTCSFAITVAEDTANFVEFPRTVCD